MEIVTDLQYYALTGRCNISNAHNHDTYVEIHLTWLITQVRFSQVYGSLPTNDI